MPFEEAIADPRGGGEFTLLEIEIDQPHSGGPGGVGGEIEGENAMKRAQVVAAGLFEKGGGLRLESAAIDGKAFFGPAGQALLDGDGDAGVFDGLAFVVGQ